MKKPPTKLVGGGCSGNLHGSHGEALEFSLGKFSTGGVGAAPGRWNAGIRAFRSRWLLQQVELAVLLVFEGVQGALPAFVVPVRALNAGLLESGGHGGCSPLVVCLAVSQGTASEPRRGPGVLRWRFVPILGDATTVQARTRSGDWWTCSVGRALRPRSSGAGGAFSRRLRRRGLRRLRCPWWRSRCRWRNFRRRTPRRGTRP